MSIEQQAQPVNVFFNIPFCIEKRRGGTGHVVGRDTRNAYLGALNREIDAAGDLFEGKEIKSVYVGGGIATVLSPDRLARTILNFKRIYNVDGNAEVTIAAAPETLVSACLSGLNICNFTRLEVEVLSYSNRTLEYLRASHRNTDIDDGFTMVGTFRYPNVGATIIYGVPNQTLAEFRNTLVTCLALPAMCHISAFEYELSAEEGVGEDERLEQYNYIKNYLKDKGFVEYGAGRFAKPGSECAYYINEGNCMERIGFGAGAVSFNDGYVINNTSDTSKYINGAGDFTKTTQSVYLLEGETEYKRYFFMKLSLCSGMDAAEFADKFQAQPAELLKETIASLISRDYLLFEGNCYSLTASGLASIHDVGNIVFGS